MELHERTLMVQKAGAALGLAICDVIEAHGLTAAEAVSILLTEAKSWNNQALRAERHPGEPDRKANQA